MPGPASPASRRRAQLQAERLEIGGERTDEYHLPTVLGMEEMEHGGVERGPYSSLFARGAIEAVADYGVADVGEVDPDLVGASGEQP